VFGPACDSTNPSDTHKLHMTRSTPRTELGLPSCVPGWRRTSLALAGIFLLLGRAHDTDPGHVHEPVAAAPLPLVIESEGPIPRPAPAVGPTGLPVTGQGFWRFTAVTNNVLSVPEAARPFVRGAHGTLIVDAPRDTVYWGLENVGWIAFSNRLSQAAIVAGDAKFSRGNLHGADLQPRPGHLPQVAVADNVEGEVYLSDTTFQRAQVLDWPAAGPYAAKGEFRPTDVAFVGPGEIYVTDGYGRAHFMPASLEPLEYLGQWHGGKSFSQTPHGISYLSAEQALLISARPEGQVKRWSKAHGHLLEVAGLPTGSTVCDLDVWGDYALAPCLDGPNRSPGPIYILNLKRRAIVSTLRPKEDLGFTEAQHIHDAAWYLAPKGTAQELYVLFTCWNPGGLGALKLVSLAE